jgi:hypothetical protein
MNHGISFILHELFFAGAISSFNSYPLIFKKHLSTPQKFLQIFYPWLRRFRHRRHSGQ